LRTFREQGFADVAVVGRMPQRRPSSAKFVIAVHSTMHCGFWCVGGGLHSERRLPTGTFLEWKPSFHVSVV
ncbi:MAG: hypothetical protein AABZ24_01140, partial [Nitrospirota bacterium]